MNKKSIGIPINQIRQDVVTDTFIESIGQRVFILLPQFPFLVIGEITEVVGDFVFVFVETTHITELEDKVLRIHIDDIHVFYIENDGPPIPTIK